MNLSELEKIILSNDFSKHDIVVTGGEPSIHEDYSEIVKLMSKYSRTTTVTSNGTLDLKLEELKYIDNLYFQISLDGDRKLHNKIRGEGTFEKTWNTIIKLDSIGLNYTAASVVSRKNWQDIYGLLSMLEELKNLRFWRISYEMPFGNAKGLEDIITADEWNEFVDKIINMSKLRLKVQKIFPFDLYERNKDKIDMVNINRKRNTNCGSGVNKLYVYPLFDVYPCTCLTDFCVGNLGRQTLNDILEGNEIKQFSEYELDDDSLCQDCDYKKYCNGGCIGMSYHYFGKIGMGDLRCPKLKK